jgi:hypothetical protein
MMMATSTHAGTAIAQKTIQSKPKLAPVRAAAEPEQQVKQAHVAPSWSSEQLATRSLLLRYPESSVAA